MSITIQTVVNWARQHTKLQPLVGIGGFTGEPAITIANDVKIKILSRPFAWKWNRIPHTSFVTNTTTRTQDYVLLADDVGYLERAYMTDNDSTEVPKPTYALEVVRSLNKNYDVGNPQKIAVERDENFVDVLRLWPIPDIGVEFRIFADYQRKPELMDALTDNFDPIPDEMQPVIRQWFLAYCYQFIDDKRYAQAFGIAQQMTEDAMALSDGEAAQNYGMVPERGLMIG